MGNYVWMLALAAAWQQHADDEPQGPQMARVDAQAGQLSQPASNAANDLAALAFISLLLWCYYCAKLTAIPFIFRARSLKIAACDQGAEIAPGPALFLALPGFSHLFPLVPNRTPPHTSSFCA